jgi:predicted O-linked N-acetylglucosamine transferase (SPINDLY family)
MAASILQGALPKNEAGKKAAKELIAKNEAEYEDRAVALGNGLLYPKTKGHEGEGSGRLFELRRLLYESRWSSALFDTRRWVRDLETAYEKSWTCWVNGEGGDINL